jgi:hypothetical protein
MTFNEYNNVILDAFKNNSLKDEIIERKKDIITKISEYYNNSDKTVLFVGFNPAILHGYFKNKQVLVTEVSDSVINYLTASKVNAKLVDINQLPKDIDIVIAMDEYLTFASSDEDQQAKIHRLSVAGDIVITSVKDYKNQEFREREYSQPALVRDGDAVVAYSEIHYWDKEDRNNFNTGVYSMTPVGCQFFGNYQRRALYFKQLAKFTKDSGAVDFVVHKNIMYKSLIKKNYEHVISINFRE